MKSNRNVSQWGFLLLATLALSCAPSAASKPAPAATGAGSASAKTSSAGGTSDGQRGGTKETDATASSLKALQEGKLPITPASSPLKDVFFDFDRYDLSADARGVLRANADWLKSNPAARVDIEGHCDERGTNDYNLALGAKRAAAAREYLASLGIAADRLSTTSYGEEIPVCQERSESCWRQNRRARFVIIERRATS